MQLYLKRIRIGLDATDGILTTLKGKRICDTAERTVSMLPEGIYSVKVKEYPKHKYLAPYLQKCNGLYGSANAASLKVTNSVTGLKRATRVTGLKRKKIASLGRVPGGFMIHCNGVYGAGFGASIILGQHLIPGVVIKSHQSFKRVMHRLDSASRRGKEVTIVIS